MFWFTKPQRTVASNTLEQTAGGKYLDSLDLFNPKNGLTGNQAAEVWNIASKRFADGASGNVNVFSTGAKRFGPFGERTWWRIEVAKRAVGTISSTAEQLLHSDMLSEFLV